MTSDHQQYIVGYVTIWDECDLGSLGPYRSHICVKNRVRVPNFNRGSCHVCARLSTAVVGGGSINCVEPALLLWPAQLLCRAVANHA
jgi:hypothetical protein